MEDKNVLPHVKQAVAAYACCHAFLYWTAHITINRIAVPIKCISAVG